MGIKSKRKREAALATDANSNMSDDIKKITDHISIGFAGFNLLGFTLTQTSEVFHNSDRFQSEGIRVWASNDHGMLTEHISHRGSQRVITCEKIGLFSRPSFRRPTMSSADASMYIERNN